MSEEHPITALFHRVEGVDLRPTYEELEAIAASRMEQIQQLKERLIEAADWLSRSVRIDDQELAKDLRKAINQ